MKNILKSIKNLFSPVVAKRFSASELSNEINIEYRDSQNRLTPIIFGIEDNGKFLHIPNWDAKSTITCSITLNPKHSH